MSPEFLQEQQFRGSFHRFFTAQPYKGIVTEGQEPKKMKIMNTKAIISAVALSIPITLISPTPSFAASQTFEFHADATMTHELYGPVANAYGYMNVITDGKGKGTINVMFSNASELDRAQFNARVKFLGARGKVMQVEIFDCWIDAEDLREAGECKVSQPLRVTGFDSVEVDFYLTDVTELSAALATY
jgi:hypothetical protein